MEEVEVEVEMDEVYVPTDEEANLVIEDIMQYGMTAEFYDSMFQDSPPTLREGLLIAQIIYKSNKLQDWMNALEESAALSPNSVAAAALINIAPKRKIKKEDK